MGTPLVPENIQNAAPAAPLNEARSKSVDSLKGFRFPVFNRGRGIVIDTTLLFILAFFIAVNVLQQLWGNRKSYAIDLDAFSFLPLTLFAFYMLLNRQAFRNWGNQVVYTTLAVFLMVTNFALNSWGFHCFLGLVALVYFLDQFIIHAIHMRSGCTNPQSSGRLAAILNHRLSLSDRAPVNLLNYVVPVLLMGFCSYYFRGEYAEELHQSHLPQTRDMIPALNETFVNSFNPYQSSIQLIFVLATVGSLVFFPVSADLFAPYFGKKRFGLRRLFKEFKAAVHSWLFYNAANSVNTAVLASPSGSCQQRRMMTIGILAFLVPVTMPLSFFTIQMDKVQDEGNKKIDKNILEIERGVGALHVPHGKYVALGQFSQDGDNNSSDTMRLAPLKSDKSGRAESKKFLNDVHEEVMSQKIENQRTSYAERLTEAPDKVLEQSPTLFAWLLAPLNPILFVLVCLFSATSRSMTLITESAGPIPIKNEFTTANWPVMVDRLSQINKKNESREILFGVNAHDQSPVIVPRSVLREHAHFLGDTGSGKSSLGISPLVQQLISFGDCSVIVLDLKADDQSLFELMRDAAKSVSSPAETEADSRNWRYPFSYFSVDNQKASHVFNPLAQRSFKSLAPVQQSELLNTALGLYYGTDYGRKFYGDANFNALNRLLTSPNANSFRQLAMGLGRGHHDRMDRESRMASTNVKFSIERLAQVAALNGPNDSEAAEIELADIFAKPQAIYFSLPAATGSVVSSDVGRLILYSILSAAQVATKPRRQVFVVIDEFQRLVSANMEVVLQMARSLDVGVILSNQSLQDLDLKGSNLLSTVLTNTRLRQIFGVSDPTDIKRLIEVSGETNFFLRVVSTVLKGVVNVQENISPRLRINDVVAATDHPSRSVFLLRRGEGTAQYKGLPFVVESVFHIPNELYRARQNASWPPESETAKIDVNFGHHEDTSEDDETSESTASEPPIQTPLESTTQASPNVIDDFLSTLDGFRDDPKP